MNFLTFVKTLVGLLPLMIQALQAIEAAIPASGQGSAKLDALKAILQSAYGAATDAVGTFEQVWPALSATASALVTLFNKTGVFSKSS